MSADPEHRIDTEALLSMVDLTQLVRERVELKKAGREWIGLCPFHQDKTAGSFTVSPQKQFYYCFACGAHGDAIDWRMFTDGVDFKEAARRLGSGLSAQRPAPEAPPERITSAPPPGTPLPNTASVRWGQPTRTWVYRDANGQPVGLVARYEYTEDGKLKKLTPQWTWGSKDEGKTWAWGMGHWNVPRPLYGLELLAERPDAPVIIVEGEKCADAIRQLITKRVGVTWPGGALAVDRVDWSPLAGRDVLLWPDADPPGIQAMQRIAEILQPIAKRVRIVDVSGREPGWDCADALAEGWTGPQTVEWLKARVRPLTLDTTPPPTPPPAEPVPPAEPPPPGPPPTVTSPEKPKEEKKPKLTLSKGGAEPEAPLVSESPAPCTIPPEITALSLDHCLVLDGGKAMIFWETHDKEFDRRVFIRIGREDFKALHANKFVPVLDRYGNPKLDRERNPKFMPLGQAWLTHPTRRTYRSVVCVPNGTVDTDTLNLWTGLAISPAPGDWSLLKAHLLTVICGGDETAYHYLIHWIARALQHPECPGEVAVVLRGLKGAGKGHLGNLLCRLFGQHAVRVDHPRHFTGHFNHHLRDCVFLFADEAHWAGDRQSEGALKGLITEPTIAIERKGVDVVIVVNRLTVLISSNEDWVVPATKDERRFFVLDVANTRAGDHTYFDALRHELKAGGDAAFLHDMLKMDLSDFNHRAVPGTAALNRQILQGLKPVEKWWYERLCAGRPVGEAHADESEWKHWGENWPRGEITVRKSQLHADYLQFCDLHHFEFHGRSTPTMLGIFMTKVLPEGFPVVIQQPTTGDLYRFPSLPVARRAFEGRRRGLFDQASFGGRDDSGN